MLDVAISHLRARGITLSRLQQLHPSIDKAVRGARRRLYTRKFFREGPRARGASRGKTFVIFNHCYDLDLDALCASNSPHTIWALDPFQMFTDVGHYFAPEEQVLSYPYARMATSIARYKAAYITDLAHRLRDQTRLDAFITPTDTAYYLRPLIEELRALGVPTIVQCKEGTIAPSPMMIDHAREIAQCYPPIAEHFFLWNASHQDFWRSVGIPGDNMTVLGQPRSDFFFHPDRWPSKALLGLTEGKKLVVAFTFDSDAYTRVTIPDPERPWLSLRGHMHQALLALARERTDVEVVFKAHPQQAELDEIRAEIVSSPLPNVHFATGAKSASHLMVRADVIVGFQTTAMIEAMLTPSPVIYVGWGPEHERRESKIVPIHRSGGVTIPQSRDELDRVLRTALDGNLAPSTEMRRARRAFTDRYFADADGNVSRRVLDAAAELAPLGKSIALPTRDARAGRRRL
ncbi:MAG: CDP-glycerol glycerophosphotransferase family protein [Myxococcota bacterium]|nr:CDP-glycerol glycerophosphotransferase family protein [Deltaproteobacteria bacterium]MDQ3336713.1 CDP-glycerol glycerophosphotransferase family protein [Myxococcota bacterium]